MFNEVNDLLNKILMEMNLVTGETIIQYEREHDVKSQNDSSQKTTTVNYSQYNLMVKVMWYYKHRGITSLQLTCKYAK